MIPPCHNRPPRKPGAWMRNGHCARTGKPRWRWVSRWYEDRCVTHIGIVSERGTYPQHHGFECGGCRWMPDGVV